MKTTTAFIFIHLNMYRLYSVSNILRRSIYLQDNIFRSSFEGLVPFSLSLCLYFLHTGHFPIWNTRHFYDHRQSRTWLHVPCCQEALILKSWSQSSRQFSLFSSSEADRRSDRWWTSQCIWSPRTQSAGRTMLQIKLFCDWLVVSSKEKILCFSAPAILFPEFEEQSLNWLKLSFLNIKVFEKYFSIHNKQSRLHVVLLKLVQLCHGAVPETPKTTICTNNKALRT